MSSRLAFDAARGFLLLARRSRPLLAGLIGCGVVIAPSARAQQTAYAPKTPDVAVPAPADSPDPESAAVFQAISGEVASIFAKCKGAVVRIRAVDSYGMHAGTGFFIDPAGTIYTHYSVVGRSWNLTVEFAGQEISRRLPAGGPAQRRSHPADRSRSDAFPAVGQLGGSQGCFARRGYRLPDGTARDAVARVGGRVRPEIFRSLPADHPHSSQRARAVG